jgi:hypothetical protein
MAVTLANLITNMNTYFGDASEDRITDTERYQFLTESVAWLNEELGNEHTVMTYNIDYLDGVNYYKVTSALGDLLTGADLRAAVEDARNPFKRISPSEIATKIANKFTNNLWAIERKDKDAYIVINHESKHNSFSIANFDSEGSDKGTWTADSTGSDATNLTYDVNEVKEGSAALNFDVDVSQSANNLATVYIVRDSVDDLGDQEDLGTFVLDVYIPDVTEVTSVSIKISSDSAGTPSTITNYWTLTATTDINGNSFVNGWNKVSMAWSDATQTASPDAEEILYYEININYGASQGDDTDFRVDNFYIVRSERLVFHYISWLVGTNTGGTDITAFTASTDIPFFSGVYDQYKYAVAHWAAGLAFYSARLSDEAEKEEIKAYGALQRYRKNFENQKRRPVKAFKAGQVNLRRRSRIRRVN